MLRNKIDMLHLYTMQELETRLDLIKNAGVEKEEENDRFREFLSRFPAEELDEGVLAISRDITERINCLDCGNCCRTFMITLNEDEAQELAVAAGLSKNDLLATYADKGNDVWVFNRIPCHFLEPDNQCRYYEARPGACSSFPHLDQPGIRQRLWYIMSHYGICPIVYNTIEQLKKQYHFS